MATFKAVIIMSGKDGYCPVYIRVVHNQKPGNIMTDKVIRNADLDMNSEIRDPFVNE